MRRLKSGPFTGQTGCSSGIPNFYNAEDLKATLSNNTGSSCSANTRSAQFPLTLSGGWEYFKQANPSDDFPQRLRDDRRL